MKIIHFQVYLCCGKGVYILGRHLGDMPWDQALSRKSHVYSTMEERADAVVQVSGGRRRREEGREGGRRVGEQ